MIVQLVLKYREVSILVAHKVPFFCFVVKISFIAPISRQFGKSSTSSVQFLSVHLLFFYPAKLPGPQSSSHPAAGVAGRWRIVSCMASAKTIVRQPLLQP